jgi:hypothetical protein
MKKTITGVLGIVLLAAAAVACIPEPAGFPLAGSNDGVPSGTTLTPYTGPTTITVADTVIDSADISACITVDAPNVHITRSRVSCSASAGIRQGDGSQPTHDSTGLAISDTEITSPNGGTVGDWGVVLKNTATLQRLYIHGTEQGALLGSGVTITDSYIGDAESQAIVSLGGVQNVTLQHNTLTAGGGLGAGAVVAYPQGAFGGPNNNWSITNNLFNTTGTACMTLGFDASQGESPNTNFNVTGNYFGTALAAQCGTSGPDSFQGLTSTIYNTTFGQPVSSGGWGWTWGDHGAQPGAVNTWYDFSGPKDASGHATPGPLNGQTVLP